MRLVRIHHELRIDAPPLQRLVANISLCAPQGVIFQTRLRPNEGIAI